MLIILSAIQSFISIYPCAWLCYLPFSDKLKYPQYRYALEAGLVSLLVSFLSAFMYACFGFDESGNIVLALFLPIMFFLYRKHVDEDIQKLLFVFCMVVHAASIIGGLDYAVHIYSGSSYSGSLSVNQPLSALLNFIRIGYYFVVGLIINRVITPKIQKIDSKNMKGMWTISGLFASVSIFISVYATMGSFSDYIYMFAVIVFAVLSFAVYNLIFRMLFTAYLNAQLEADNTARERISFLKTELLHKISHEMRTPLSVIKGYAEISRDEARKTGISDGLLENLDTIAAEASRIADLAEKIRSNTFAKEYHKDISSVDIGALIRQVVGLYGKYLEKKGVRLECFIEDNLPPVAGGEYCLKQIIFNLLRNAEIHSGSDDIRISVCSELSDVKVSVSDTGIGIAPDVLPHIFEFGYSPGKQSGYGLPICKDILHGIGGRLWIESDGTNGTNAVFTLPYYGGG